MYREPLRWQTHLGRWVTDLTANQVVLELCDAGAPVTASAVYKWVAGECLPRPEVAMHLVEISRGTLSFADIYGQRLEVSRSPLETREAHARAVGA